MLFKFHANSASIVLILQKFNFVYEYMEGHDVGHLHFLQIQTNPIFFEFFCSQNLNHNLSKFIADCQNQIIPKELPVTFLIDIVLMMLQAQSSFYSYTIFAKQSDVQCQRI